MAATCGWTPLGYSQSRRDSQTGGRIGGARARRHPCPWCLNRGAVAAGDTHTGDPVGAGFVDSLARPGGNVTGFMTFEYSMSGKWVELLKQIAPGVARAAVIRDAGSPTGMASFGVIQAMAPSLNVEVTPVNMPNAGEIERVVTAFAQSPNGGLIVTASGPAFVNRDLIIALAARHKLPAVYFERSFV